MVGVIVCADDFGLTEGVSRAIKNLVQRQRLSAVSCMVEGLSFQKYAADLKKFHNSIDIGLHLTLSDQRTHAYLPTLAPNGEFLSFIKILQLCFLRQVQFSEILSSITYQFKLFENEFGFSPDFVDGHHHVQNLPLIRDALVSWINQMPEHKRPYIRLTKEKWPTIVKRDVAVVKAFQLSMLSNKLAELCESDHLEVNSGFSGAYYLKQPTIYSEVFARFLHDVNTNSIVMCHPGFVDNDLLKCDTLTSMRKCEYDFLQSNEYLEILDQRKISIKKFTKAIIDQK